jgi:hypothetical protein
MERPDIETGAKLLLCAIAEIENPELTDLVAEGLSWPCNIPVNFSLASFARYARSTAFCFMLRARE